MVEPQFFFSTIAQASAAVVGFIVAVAAALYTLERQRVERRTDDFRDSLTEFANRYGFAIETLAQMLANEGGDLTKEMKDVSKSREELRELAHEECDEYPITSLFLAHIVRIHGFLTRINPQYDYLLSSDELESLEESIDWYYDHFNQTDDTSEAFIEEATGEPYDEEQSLNEICLFGEPGRFRGFRPHQLKRWFERRQQIESDVLRPDTDGLGDDEWDPLQGDNFWTLKSLSEYLRSDFRDVKRKSHGTVLDYDPGIQPVVKVSSYLILTGVFLPTAFLFTAPVTLPNWAILLSQIVLLGTSLLLSLTLIELVLRSTNPSNQMGETDNLSRHSSFVVKWLPDLPY